MLTKAEAPGEPLVTSCIGPHYEKRPASGDGTTSLYYALGRLVAERPFGRDPAGSGEKMRFRFADHLRSSAVVANDSLAVEWVQTYRPYGLDSWGTEPSDSTRKFTGQEQDYEMADDLGAPQNAIYDFKARSYLPGVGVFAQADSWEGKLDKPQTLNPYAYAKGNPLKYTDPTGHYEPGDVEPDEQPMGSLIAMDTAGDLVAAGIGAWNATGGALSAW